MKANRFDPSSDRFPTNVFLHLKYLFTFSLFCSIFSENFSENPFEMRSWKAYCAENKALLCEALNEGFTWMLARSSFVARRCDFATHRTRERSPYEKNSRIKSENVLNGEKRVKKRLKTKLQVVFCFDNSCKSLLFPRDSSSVVPGKACKHTAVIKVVFDSQSLTSPGYFQLWSKCIFLWKQNLFSLK